MRKRGYLLLLMGTDVSVGHRLGRQVYCIANTLPLGTFSITA